MEINDKKPKRPRIGENRVDSENEAKSGYASRDTENPTSENSDSQTNGYTSGSYQQRPYQQRPYQQRPYQPRPYGNRQQGGYNSQGGYNRQGGYNNHNNRYGYGNQGGYNRPGGYQQRPYQQRQDYHAPSAPAEGTPAAEGSENTTPATASQPTAQGGYQQRPYQQRPYQPRPYNNNRPGGYQPRQQGGYQPRPYGNRPQGGYNRQPGGQGGYQPRPYGNRPQGGYNNRQQGGYNRQPGGMRPRQNQYGMPYGGKSFVPRPKPVEYEVPVPDPDEQVRLNKYMANAGICSRREADEFIRQGLVKVNGETVTELGTKITCNDTVEYDDKIVTLERKCYILLNKPKDCVTTSDDPNGRLTVMDVVKGACNERIYPVGRLDRNTTGVLLLTNDGDLASKLTHPKYVKKKIYHVWTDKDISEDDMQRIADGIELDDGPIHADAISYATETDRNQAGIEIHSGRNRIVRRIFEHLGYHVTKLDRVYFAGLTKKNLPRGRWRYLTQEEVNFLKMGAFE